MWKQREWLKKEESLAIAYGAWRCLQQLSMHYLIIWRVIVVRKMKDKRMGSLINEWFILHGDWRGSRDVMLWLFYIQKGKAAVCMWVRLERVPLAISHSFCCLWAMPWQSSFGFSLMLGQDSGCKLVRDYIYWCKYKIA